MKKMKKMRHFVNYMRKKNIMGSYFQHYGMKDGKCVKIKTVGQAVESGVIPTP